MARGDQIYVMRDVMGIPYEHHGIDCGDGTVIHYSKVGTAAVSRTSYERYSWGNPVYTQLYSTCFIPEVVIQRAESRLGEQRYDFFFNNCEHFATWCKTGRNDCRQLQNFGLKLDQIKVPQVGQLANQAARDEAPEAVLGLFKTALDNLAIATNTLLPDYQKTQNDIQSWQKVAQKALSRNREDLARAALHRKVVAKKKAQTLKQQLAEISDLQLTIQRDQETARQRLQIQ